MNRNAIVISSVVAGMALAGVVSNAQAGACLSAFQFSWLSQARCPGVNGSLGFSQGNTAVPPALNARLAANMQVAVGGGSPDGASAFGFDAGSQIVGTAACAQGQGAPGCILCAITDTNTSSASFANTPIGACVNAVKHRLQISF
jgi:hypothetical protein